MDDSLIKEILQELKVIRETQIKLEVDVRHHVKRSDQFEDTVIALEAKVDKQVQAIDSKVSKIEIPYKISLFLLSTMGLIAIVAQILSFTK
jgi:hypothetical protein